MSIMSTARLIFDMPAVSKARSMASSKTRSPFLSSLPVPTTCPLTRVPLVDPKSWMRNRSLSKDWIRAWAQVVQRNPVCQAAVVQTGSRRGSCDRRCAAYAEGGRAPP